MKKLVALEEVHQLCLDASSMLNGINGEIKVDLSEWPRLVAVVSDTGTRYTLTMDPASVSDLVVEAELLMGKIMAAKERIPGGDAAKLAEAEQHLDDAIAALNAYED